MFFFGRLVVFLSLLSFSIEQGPIPYFQVIMGFVYLAIGIGLASTLGKYIIIIYSKLILHPSTSLREYMIFRIYLGDNHILNNNKLYMQQYPS